MYGFQANWMVKSNMEAQTTQEGMFLVSSFFCFFFCYNSTYQYNIVIKHCSSEVMDVNDKNYLNW